MTCAHCLSHIITVGAPDDNGTLLPLSSGAPITVGGPGSLNLLNLLLLRYWSDLNSQRPNHDPWLSWTTAVKPGICVHCAIYRAMPCIARTMLSQYVCLSVRHRPVFYRNGSVCHHSRVRTSLQHQTSWQYSDADPLTKRGR